MRSPPTARAVLDQRGLLRLLITQNVDGLHSTAGSRNVVDLHVRLDRSLCLDCSASPRTATASAPDGSKRGRK
jgi:NAD-dependent SIR2 family protein deacetylase